MLNVKNCANPTLKSTTNFETNAKLYRRPPMCTRNCKTLYLKQNLSYPKFKR